VTKGELLVVEDVGGKVESFLLVEFREERDELLDGCLWAYRDDVVEIYLQGVLDAVGVCDDSKDGAVLLVFLLNSYRHGDVVELSCDALGSDLTRQEPFGENDDIAH